MVLYRSKNVISVINSTHPIFRLGDTFPFYKLRFNLNIFKLITIEFEICDLSNQKPN